MKVKNMYFHNNENLKRQRNQRQSGKNIFSYKPIMGNILKYTVAEYSDCSLEEIIKLPLKEIPSGREPHL